MWRKSSRSGPASGNGGGNCVEVGTLLGEVGVRDSKLGNASTPLWVAPTDWAALLDTVRTDA
ncbi:MAG: DUF397 domain-containing protein [Stackebrandtia sp.]